MNVTLVKRFRFEAAHRLTGLPKGHKCGRLHGHGYEVEIEVRGKVDPKRGWYIDYADMSRAFKPLLERLDHSYLNRDVPGLKKTTSEAVARWIWERLELPGLYRVSVFETPTTGCHYLGD